MKIFLTLSFIFFSIFINKLKEELNLTNTITKIILDDKLPKPTAWKIDDFLKSLKGKKDILVGRNLYEKENFDENNKKFFDKVEKSYFNNLKNIYYSSIPLNKKIKTFRDHPVLYGYYKAWIDHCPILISPNIIWQLILNGIVQLINDNSEKYRHNFVLFKDKKTLKFEINIPNPIIKKKDWERFIYNISKQIKENTKKDIYDNIILNFTTNTKDLLLVQQISSMSLFKKYFEYKFIGHVICGFPYIELEGEIEDWQLIFNKIQKFKNFGIDNWIETIEKILIKIINSKKGEIDIQFWKNLIIYREVSEQNKMCGSPEPMIGFTGWITNFFPYNNQGEYLYENKLDSFYKNITIYDDTEAGLFMTREEFNLISEINETPIKLHIDYPNDKEKIEDLDLIIYSGILGVSQDPDTFLVKPELGFFITENNEKDSAKFNSIEEDIISYIRNSTNWNNTDL